MSASNYLENRITNTLIGKSTTLVAPSTLWIALKNTTGFDSWLPTDTGEIPKATTNYVRKKFTNSTALWTKGTTGGVTNKSNIVFHASASTGWGTVRSWAIVDTSSTSAGNTWIWANLNSPAVITSGNTVQFTTGAFVVGTD